MSHRIHLSKDKKLKKIFLLQEELNASKKNNIHLQLCAAIISQQLSTKVADVIYGRFLLLFKKKTPSAKEILSTRFDVLRSIGLSNAKANYVLNVCNFFIENKITDAKLYKMTDEEVVALLTKIKGIGSWTAEMILMFSLGREDVFAVDDLGIQQAMAKLYQINTADKKILKQEMLSISARWQPYRTYACRYLWRWKDGV